MAKYSNPEIAAAYERGVQAGILKGPTLEPSGYANLLSTLGQNIAGMAKSAQAATTAEVTAILDGISKIEASAQAGVDAKAMDMWQNYQDNLTKLQTAAAQVDTVVLRKATEEATNIAGKQDVNDTEWRREYLKSIVTQLQDGSGRPFLYGTMQAAMSTLGYVDKNTGAIMPGSMTQAVGLLESLEDPHLTGLAKSLFQNYASQGTYYAGVESELQNLNTIIQGVQASGGDAKVWYESNKDQWERFVRAHDQFRANTLPYLEDRNGAFYADLEATIAPEMSGALAYQQGFYEGLTGGGTGGSTVSKDDLQYKLARYISSPAAQRTAADWGFNIGRIVPVTDESQKAMILRQFPTGVYFEDLGGIYVPGPDDRTMAKWSAKREDRSDPRGTLLEQAFGRHYRKETEYVDLTLKGPASSAGAKPTAEAAMPFSKGWEIRSTESSWALFTGTDKDGAAVWILVDIDTKEVEYLTPAEAKVYLDGKKGDVEAMDKKLLDPDVMKILGYPPTVQSETVSKETPSPSASAETPATGETLRNVQVVPARTGDPIGSINIIDPVTGGIRNISAEEVEDIVTVGGGGERQDLQTFVKRVRALRSQARGIAAANKSAATAAEHPESAAYSSTRATDAAEAFRSDETRGGKVWNEARKRWEVPAPLEPSKDEVPSMLTPEAEAKRAAEEAAAEQDKEKAVQEAIDQALKSGRQPAPPPPPGTPPPPKPTYYQLGNALYTFWPADPSDPMSKNRYIVRDERGTRLATEEDMMAFSEGLNMGIAKEVPAPAPAPVQPPAPAPLPETRNEQEIQGRTTGSGADAQVAPPTFRRGLVSEPPKPPPSDENLKYGALEEGSQEEMDQKQKQNEQERKREQKQKEDEAEYSIGGIPSDVEVAPLPGTPGEGTITPLPGTPGEGTITPMSDDKPESSGKAEPKPTDKRTASLKAFVSGYNRAPSSATVPPAGGNPGYPNAVKQVA